MPESILDNVCVVLHEPQDPVNIAAVVRAMKNMGVPWLRLVRPVPYDPIRLQGIAHDTVDVMSEIRHFDTLDEALADCVRVAAFSARARAARWARSEPRAEAAELIHHAAGGMVALLFGREDSGLDNDALDRAHVMVTIPTTEHPSLNLAQAVVIALYEVHREAATATRRLPGPRRSAPLATAQQMERFFGDAGRALEAIDFFKTRNPEHIMRVVRSLAGRAMPDSRELELVRAMCFEVLRTIDRVRAGRS